MTISSDGKDAPAVGEDPRIARSRAAILAAAAGLLVEVGAPSVTIERVSERSGVAKTTIYRHFPSRSELILAAFESLFQPGAQEPLTGPIREYLVAFLCGLIHGLSEAPWAPAVAGLVEAGERDPELRQLIHEFLVARMEPCKAAMRDASQRGELPRDLDADAALASLAGPIFYRRLISREPLELSLAPMLVDQFLAGVRAR